MEEVNTGSRSYQRNYLIPPNSKLICDEQRTRAGMRGTLL
jgi:hypothetical protein